MSVVSKLQLTHASRSSHSWLSKQPQLVKSSKLVVASLSCAELGTAQPQLVLVIKGKLEIPHPDVHHKFLFLINYLLGPFQALREHVSASHFDKKTSPPSARVAAMRSMQNKLQNKTSLDFLEKHLTLSLNTLETYLKLPVHNL